MVVSGEAGIGKTSLIQSFTNDISTDVYSGMCDPLSTPRPLAPLLDIVQQSNDIFNDLTEAMTDRFQMFSYFMDALKKLPPGTVIIFEDIHWADSATLDLIKYLGRRIQTTSVMLVLSYRDDEVTVAHPLQGVLGVLSRSSQVEHIKLTRLSVEAVAELVSHRDLDANSVYDITGGNPYFVTEILASGLELLPRSVTHAILARTTNLSQAQREILELLAMVPGRTPVWLLNATIAPSAADLEACIGTGLIRTEHDEIIFQHELGRLTIQNSVMTLNQTKLNKLIVDELLRHETEKLIPSTKIVHHAVLAGQTDTALEYAIQAAKQAQIMGAHHEARSHYQTAFKSSNHVSSEVRADILHRLAYECYLTGNIQDAIKYGEQSLAMWREVMNIEREGSGLRWLSRYFWYHGDRENALQKAELAIEKLNNTDFYLELAMAYSNLSQLHMLAHESIDAIDWGTKAIKLAEEYDLIEPLIHALNNIGASQVMNDLDVGRENLDRSLQLALKGQYHEHAARAYTNLGWNFATHRQYDIAQSYLADGITFTTDFDLDSWNAYMRGTLAQIYFEQGRWNQAMDEALSILDFSANRLGQHMAKQTLAHLRLRRGDPESRELIETVVSYALQTDELQRIVPAILIYTEYSWLNDNLSETVLLLKDLYDRVTRSPGEFYVADVEYWLWRAGALQDSTAPAGHPYTLQVNGKWEQAARLWAQIGCPYEHAIALADSNEAVHLREALKIMLDLQARPAVSRLQQKLREMNADQIPRGKHKSTRENPAKLTNRQMDVLELLAENLSNAEIAQKLFISPKTVEHHVTAILFKLEVESRQDAADFAREYKLQDQN